MTLKKTIRNIHLWLGLGSGLIVLFLGITGCILAFEREITDATQPFRFSKERPVPLLPPSALKTIAVKELPDKTPHSVQYLPGRSAQISFYSETADYYYIVFADPYTGKVLKVKNMNDDFFRIVVMGHYYLWLPPAIGQPIITSGTLIFVLLLITGIVLWWPKRRSSRKQRFNIRWNTTWQRINYDLHNVLGFYVTWIIIFTALTGMVMGFQWFAKTVYWTSSGGKSLIEYSETYAGKSQNGNATQTSAVDLIWHRLKEQYPSMVSMEMHFPQTDSSAIEAAVNPDPETYWEMDFRYFDQNNLKEIEVNHLYGRYKNASAADKLARMNYDIHVGAIWGIAGKCIAFFASLIAASLPVTGFLIWRGRRKKFRNRLAGTTPAQTARKQVREAQH